MKSLTEIVKNVKTRGKNLAVYSSMLLALGGAYYCGNEMMKDDVNVDGGVQNENISKVDCGKLVSKLDGCYAGDLAWVCANQLNRDSQTEYRDTVNKCLDKEKCSNELFKCLKEATNGCTLIGDAKQYANKYCWLAQGCSHDDLCINELSDSLKCTTPEAIDREYQCLLDSGCGGENSRGLQCSAPIGILDDTNFNVETESPIDCETVCQTWQSDSCGCKTNGTNIFTDLTVCENTCKDSTSFIIFEYADKINKCFNETSVCTERGTDCLESARNVCLPEGCSYDKYGSVTITENCTAEKLRNKLKPVCEAVCKGKEKNCDKHFIAFNYNSCVTDCDFLFYDNCRWGYWGYSAISCNSACLNQEGTKNLESCLTESDYCEGGGPGNGDSWNVVCGLIEPLRTGAGGLFSFTCKSQYN